MYIINLDYPVLQSEDLTQNNETSKRRKKMKKEEEKHMAVSVCLTGGPHTHWEVMVSVCPGPRPTAQSSLLPASQTGRWTDEAHRV